MTGWRKSSYSFSNGNCLEAAPAWRKASFSATGSNCAEVGTGAAGILVRDTKDRDGVVLWFPAQAWRAFGESLAGGNRSNSGPARAATHDRA